MTRAGVAARFAFAGLKEAVEGFDEAVGLAGLSVASKAECSTMPHSALFDCTVLRAPSRVRFAGLRPPLTAPAGRSSSDPTHSDFKRGPFNRDDKCLVRYK